MSDVQDKMLEESTRNEDSINVIPIVNETSAKPLYDVIEKSDVVLTEVCQNKVTDGTADAVLDENVLPHTNRPFGVTSDSKITDRINVMQTGVHNVSQTGVHNASQTGVQNVSQTPSHSLVQLAAALQKPTSSVSRATTSVAQAAHNAFLASQQGTHPILQQIQDLSQKYGNQDVILVTGKELSSPAAAAAAQVDDELGRLAQDGVNETISTEIFSGYRHREILPGCKPHPGDIVEAGPLAAITPPDPYYPLDQSLPKEIILEGKLSSLQLEGVIQACQRHQMILPNGQRAGFFIGDAAGVGKGRQISGVILDNFARGRTKSIWFTISADLIVDTRRDLSDLGCYIKVIDGCQELDKHTRVLGLPADFREGVVFSTYATLVSTVQKGGAFTSGRQSRLQQLVDWCGGEQFDGCLVFDECHKAKNFVPGKEQASTKIALAVTSIQRMLPKARVLYCSATGVTDVKNMAFMERLGLWGEGAPYKNFEQFLVSVQKKGLGMAEMLAMEMKSAGMYVSRGLSYKQAEFLTIEATLTKEQVKMYDTAVHVWNELRKALESAVVRTTNNYTRLWTQFWSCHQRFFKQLCLGMKVPTIVKEAETAINDGFCIVIGLQTTGEASLESELDKSSGSVTGFMSLCREMLTRFIDQYFPTRVDAPKEGEVKEDPWSVTAKKMLLDFAGKIALPDSPLDEIIDKLGGPSNVAEMTGRKGRIARPSPTEKPRYETRTADSDAYGAIDSLNVRERNMFMEGKKLVAIISDAASTGISLHADQRVGNQRRRVHLTVELPWSADKAVQQLGRSHRSNQSSGPLYKLLTTDLGGERRFAAAVARRLQSLGALTKGDRRAATGADLTEFNFDTPYGRNALRTMYNHISNKTMVPGLSLNVLTQGKYDFEMFSRHMQVSLVLMGLVDVDMLRSGPVLKEKDTGDVSKFLNRILGLSVEKQNMIFTYFTECMKLGIQNAKKEGRYNEGMLDITASSVEMVGKPKEIFKEFNKGHTSTRLVELNIDRGMSWEQAVTRADNHSQKQDGFYISKRDVWGKKLFILATQKENSSHLFRIARPNTGLSYFEEEKTDLMQRYARIDRADAEKGWKEQYEITRTSCVHGSHCKNKDFCKVGSRCYSLHLLCGSIVTFMNVLETTLNRNATKLNLSKSESSIRVVRVKLNDGERVVGIRYPQILIPEVETALKEQRFIEKVQQSQPQILQHLSSSQGAYNGLSQAFLLSQGVQPAGASGLFQGSQLSQQINSSPVLQNGLSQSTQSSSGLTQILNTPTAKSAHSSSSEQNNMQSPSNSDTQKAVIQEVTPVNSKCLAKALKPPVTIKNFFKPSLSSKTVDGENLASEKMDSENQTSGTDNKNSKKSYGKTKIKKKKIKKEISYEDFLESSDKGETSVTSNSIEETKQVDKDNTGDTVAVVALEDSSSCKGSKSDSNDGISSYFKNSSAKKRTLDDGASSQPNKRPKQATLFSTFKKMATKKEKEETKLATCPICSQVFEKGLSNVDLNLHIDNCVIE